LNPPPLLKDGFKPLLRAILRLTLILGLAIAWVLLAATPA